MKYIILLILSISVGQSTTVKHLSVDNESSRIIWRGNKSTGAYHKGSINLIRGQIKLIDNNIIGGNILMDMTSITCNDIKDSSSNQSLVGHLKGEDFFSVEHFPNASLTLLEFNQSDDNINDYLVAGELTILDQTHPVEFTCSISISSDGAKADGIISVDRSIYGIKYKSKTWYKDLGDRFIEDTFYIYFSLIALPD